MTLTAALRRLLALVAECCGLWLGRKYMAQGTMMYVFNPIYVHPSKRFRS